jgi:hypothetical protein
MTRPRGTAGTTIDCGTSESRLGLLDEQFCASAWPCRLAPFCARIYNEEEVLKIFVRLIPCNPLISHDSDERIQGNPSFSNPVNRGIPKPKSPGSRNPKRSGQPAHPALKAPSQRKLATPRRLRSRIFLRRVLRFSPRISAALIWLPRVQVRVAAISGASRSCSTRW